RTAPRSCLRIHHRRAYPKPTLFPPRTALPGGFFRTTLRRKPMRVGRPMDVRSPSLTARRRAEIETAPFVSSTSPATSSLPCLGQLGCSHPAGPLTDNQLLPT